MSTQNQELLVLYDIPTKQGAKTWSPNVWRTRLALNYKGLRYRTEWVEYPDIEKVGKELGAKPTGLKPDGSGDGYWTCPMLLDPNRLDSEGKPTVLSDSYHIARYLDTVYPEPQLFPTGTFALHKAWARFVSQYIHNPLVDLMLPVCPNILAPRSKEYFVTTREAWFMPLIDLCPDRKKAWKMVQEGLDHVAEALDENGVEEAQNLRVIPGRTSYADFMLLAPFLWAVALSPEEESEALKARNDGRWGKLLELHEDLLVIE
ncbi:hypothetical protein D9615_003257 [Tricholomella constricta]|uniref:GST N-terminal domain-containing protein n=1 Tax=Tricholomella constricta TaxID=117010 RepID=A0A8H5HJC9_9AGAR|nr:hypothetical protein D9615_003257 [Tricholomella constricta]